MVINSDFVSDIRGCWNWWYRINNIFL